MRNIRFTILTSIAGIIALQAYGADLTSEDHIKNAEEHWANFQIKPAVIEWRKALKLDPKNEKAKKALSKLDETFEKNDRILSVIEQLIENGLTEEARIALRQWRGEFANRDQVAKSLILKGRMEILRGAYDDAAAAFVFAESLASSPATRQEAELHKAEALSLMPGKRQEGLALLLKIANGKHDKNTNAKANWLLIKSQSLQPRQRVSTLQKFLTEFPDSPSTTEAHSLIAQLTEKQIGRPNLVSIKHLISAYEKTSRPSEKRAASKKIKSAIARITDSNVTIWLTTELMKLNNDMSMPYPPYELAALSAARTVKLTRSDEALKSARKMQSISKTLANNQSSDERVTRWKRLGAQGTLMEGQLLLMKERDLEAMEPLTKATQLYTELLASNCSDAGEPLLRIGRLLENRGRPDGAAYHYKLVANSFPSEHLGSEALWQLAEIYRTKLDRPLKAIEVFQRYQDLYPPSFRTSSSSEERIQRLGYPDVAAFQAAHGIKVDGVLGPETLNILKKDENSFREILPENISSKPLKGKMIHNIIFQIAQSLETRGRYREALHAYQSFLSMYPGHNLGDNALLNISRIFKKNDLFNEAVAAYERLMEDYPNGDQTSHAYIEAAYCHECLGNWDSARDLYDMYLKKFPKYNRSATARKNLIALKKLIRYSELVEEKDLPDSKMADALYEMGRILYNDISNRQKAAQIFISVAKRNTKTYHNPDAWFSAGVCLLHEKNFEDARSAFTSLIKEHSKSRLADDAQYWIGHTLETQAESLSTLNRTSSTLAKRSAKETSMLRQDLNLRRAYWSKANEAGVAWHQPHPDVLKSGRVRDKVRDDYHAAIIAFKRVVEKYPLGDMSQKALLRVGSIYNDNLKNPEKAVIAYHELLKKYPGSKAAVDAQFEVGQHYLKNNKLDSAEKAINLFLSSFPNHAKAGEAMLNLAECHRRRKNWIQALDSYQSYANRYPNSQMTPKIKEEIAWIKKYRF